MDTIREKQEALMEKMLDTLNAMDDPSSDEFSDLLEAATKLNDSMAAFDKNRVETLKVKTNAEVEKMKSESTATIEQAKADRDTKVEKGRSLGTIVSAVINAILTALTIGAGIWSTKATIEATNARFDRATAKEEFEPITTLTNKTTVQDGLRNDKPFNKFFH